MLPRRDPRRHRHAPSSPPHSLLEKRVASTGARTDRLTQAILARAFRGELVPTEAELARHEGRSYEPASVLLERRVPVVGS